MSANSSPHSDSSLSLSPDLLPEDNKKDHGSGASSISEHISSINSVENDRSFQEIEISNVPSNLSQILRDHSGEFVNISQENRPSLNSSFRSDEATLTNSASKNVHSILEEILGNEQFRSQSERLKSDSYHSNDNSLNIFEGVNLDDSSINDYVLRLRPTDDVDHAQNLDDESERTIKNLKELLSAKDSVVAALSSELDSYKEGASNQSTFSLTEYKQCQEECLNKIVEFKNALSHRDDIIEDLKDSLQKSLANEQELRADCEQFANEIQALQIELSQAVAYIKNHQCSDIESKEDALVDEELNKGCETKDDSKIDDPINKGCGLDEICSKLEDELSPAQAVMFGELKMEINNYLQKEISNNKVLQNGELKILKDKLEQEKNDYNTEITRLRELLASVRCGSIEIEELRRELNEKYMQEMEELRTYYEKRCADMEKHYSDEVFSQQSRKMSGSSTGSEPEFASDLIFASAPPHSGGGGDPGTPLRSKDYMKNLSKSDLQTFKKHLSNFTTILDKYDMEKVSENDLRSLKAELDRLDVKGLLKIDLTRLRNDLQTKYNAELEILRDDYDNRIDQLNIEHEDKVKEVEKGYEEQIEGLKYDLEEAQKNIQLNINSAIQEVAKSGEYELADIVKSYQTKLQEQVALAKCDILSALVNQIQMLADNPCEDSQWPEEFLEIRNKFTEKYEEEINTLKEKHEEEIVKLKEENLKALNGALERARRRSLKDDSSEIEILKERNSLRKKSTVLRNLLSELLKYFTQCEDELNNTLVEELVKQGMTESELDINLSDSKVIESISLSKRVHLTPNIEELINLVENPSIDSNELDFKGELGTCLNRLRTEANEILALTANIKEKQEIALCEDHVKSLEERISSLTRQMITDSQIKEDLSGQLSEAQAFAKGLDNERVALERQTEQLVAKNRVLKEELAKARDKIGELIECGRKEIVSEGYGENDKIGLQGGIVSRATLAELQERAKILAAKSSVQSDNPLLQLVEDLCREADRIIEDAGKERDDYLQQIEAADKKLRATTQFLEEQAVEREQERDEAQKNIAMLKDQLREREKDRASYERISREVEQLENQMRDMTKLIEEGEQRNLALDTERKEAVDKIGFLRDIIRDLETQVEVKTTAEGEFKDIIVKLQDVIKQQREANDDLTAQLENGGDSANYREHIIKLEEEVGKLRLTSELAGNEGVLKQLQLQLHEVEINIDKATQDLEGLHSTISATSCSSPSEEMSIRDQIRPQTPSSTMDESDIPLQQLARLKEKLIKHSRAEHAAIKRIHDLEMQLVSTKHEHDEIQNERDVLQEQVSEQLVLISSLQMRLDDQRIRTEHMQKQTNASLEVRIYDLENELQNLRDTLHSKENLIKQLNKTIEQTNDLLKEREQELCSSAEESALMDLQCEINRLKNENQMLKSKIDSDAQNAQILPGLVDNILSDKNRDIESLRQRLSETERQLDLYLTLNLDRDQIKKGDERGLISFVNLSGPEQLRKAENRNDSLELSGESIFPRRVNFETTEISNIERIGSPKLNFTSDAPMMKPNSTEIQKSCEKRVQFKETQTDEIKELREKVLQLEANSEQINELEVLYKREQEDCKNLRIELAEVKMHLSESEKKNELLKDDGKRKDDMYFKLAKEKHDLERKLNDGLLTIEENQNRVDKLDEELNLLKMNYDRMVNENTELKNNLVAAKELEKAYTKLQITEEALQAEVNKKVEEMNEADELNQKLQKEIQNKMQMLENINEQMIQLKSDYETKINELQQNIDGQSIELKNLQSEMVCKQTELSQNKALLDDRECELEILNEDITRYQNDIANLESRLKSRDNENEQLKSMKQRKEVAEKDLEIVKLKTAIGDLKKEIIHLQDFLNEKDKIIEQITLDSESLRQNLETIKEKMNEDGNVVDLREKLQQERQINAQLRSELGDKIDLAASMDDISEQVRKHLDDSANLDESILKALNSGEYAPVDDVEVLRTSLNREREHNSDLLNERKDLEITIKLLQQQITLSSEAIKQLEVQLDNEKKICSRIQIEDANLLEQMRIKLEEAMENENEFENVLKEEKVKRAALEAEIRQLRLRKEAVSSTSSKTEYKSLPDSETLRIRAELQQITEENSRLKKDLKNVKKLRNEAEASLKYAKEMLNIKDKEVEDAEGNFKSLSDEIMGIKEKYVEVKVQLEQRNREVENSRVLMAEIEQEKLDLKIHMDRLTQKMHALQEEKELREEADKNRNAEMSSSIPEKFLQKMKDLGDLVSIYIKENKGMTDTLVKLTDERNQLQDRIRELEDGLNMKLPFDDPVARANHLFGKYLRADSYRNALAWQKKYLIRLLATYQDFQPFPTNPLNKFEPRKSNKPVRSRGIRRFKSVVCVVIAICRMKYMVQRWHSGTRGAAYMSLQRKFRMMQPQQQQVTAQFQVGQPVSSQHFTTNRVMRERTFTDSSHSRASPYEIPRATTPPMPENLPPWSGFTPPSKDRLYSTRRYEFNNSPSTSTDNLLPLQTSEITKCLEKFDIIHQRLGLASNNHNT